MPTEIETILTESEYEAALVEIEKLWHAKPGTPECDRLDRLANRVVDYEDLHFPMGEAERAEEARRDAEAMADLAAGRVIPHEIVSGWLTKLANGERVPLPRPWEDTDTTKTDGQ